MEPKSENKPAVPPAAPAPAGKSGTLLQEVQKPARIEVNRELAALGAKAAEVDKLAGAGTVTGTAGKGAAPAPGQAPAPMPALPGTVQEVRLIVGMARPAVEMLVPYLRGADPAAWEALVEPAAALCDHYGISLGSWMQSPWARLAGAAVPLTMHGFAEWQKAQAKPAALPQPAPVVRVPEGKGGAQAASEPAAPAVAGVTISL